MSCNPAKYGGDHTYACACDSMTRVYKYSFAQTILLPLTIPRSRMNAATYVSPFLPYSRTLRCIQEESLIEPEHFDAL
eukprot:6184769-Pleurochrysis_carterae.AAC.1